MPLGGAYCKVECCGSEMLPKLRACDHIVMGTQVVTTRATEPVWENSFPPGSADTAFSCGKAPFPLQPSRAGVDGVDVES